MEGKLAVHTIAFIAAMKEELAALVDEFSPKSETDIIHASEGKVDITIIQYKGIKIIAALSGVGKVNSAYTTTVLLVKYHPDIVINVGVAGGFDKAQKILDFAIAESFIYTDVDITNLNFKPGQIMGEPLYFPASEKLNCLIKSLEDDMRTTFSKEFQEIKEKRINFHYGILGSSDQFIYRDDQVKNIQKNFPNVICVEMEGASIAHVCYKFDTPIVAIRSLSDIAVSKEDNTVDFSNSLEVASKSAAMLSILLVEKISKEQSI